MHATRDETIKAIGQIVVELIDDPKFCIEDIAAAIYERIIMQRERKLLAQFEVGWEIYQRTKV